MTPEPHTGGNGPAPEPHAFYGRVLDELIRSGVPFLVGGAYAFMQYTKIKRWSRDFDVFVLPSDARRVLDHFDALGLRTEMAHAHWLGKIHDTTCYVDVIFSSGNGVARVDDRWFEHATPTRIFERDVRLCPPEEMMWSKAFVLERERFDGADVAHLLLACAEQLDWARLIERFGPLWEVLLAHLILFRFVYPGERRKVPEWVMRELMGRIERQGPESSPVCRGPLLTRSQYLPDLEAGYKDGRLVYGAMSEEEIARWTAAADDLPELQKAPHPADPEAAPGRTHR